MALLSSFLLLLLPKQGKIYSSLTSLGLRVAGQTKSTRVIRFLAEGTIEAAVLDFQRRKMQQPGEEEEVAASHLQDLDPASILSLVNDHP